MTGPTLRTADQLTLRGRRWPGSDEPAAAVVLVHGFSASADCPHVGSAARALAATGLDVVSYDARGHGGSDGECTLGDLERHDVAAAVDLARSRAERVVLVGASMGAIAVLRHAADDSTLAGVVAVSCPSRWRVPRTPRAVLAAGLTRTALGRAVMARAAGVRVARHWTSPAPPLALVPRVRVPLAIVHGADDRFIPAREATELHAVAGEPCRLSVVPGMGHAFDVAGLPEVVAAVAWTLEVGDGEREGADAVVHA